MMTTCEITETAILAAREMIAKAAGIETEKVGVCRHLENGIGRCVRVDFDLPLTAEDDRQDVCPETCTQCGEHVGHLMFDGVCANCRNENLRTATVDD